MTRSIASSSILTAWPARCSIARPDETARLRALVKLAAGAALRSVRQAGREEGQAAALRQMYGLTAAEARLTLRLLPGRGLPTAAAALGISVHTAKTLLARVFIRTGTNRQSGMVGKILRGPLGAVSLRR